MFKRRSRQLPKPAMQMKFAAVTLVVAAIAVVAQAGTLMYTLTEVANGLPLEEGQRVMQALPGLLATNLSVTFLILIPLMLGFGILATFRIAGPLHSFEGFLREVAGGRRRAPCTIRDKDELHEMCRLLNEVTAPLREHGQGPGEERPDPPSLVGDPQELEDALETDSPAA